jgi:hypothetical protein
MNRREFVKNITITGAGLVLGANLIGCATLAPGRNLEKRVSIIASEIATFPKTYPSNVNKILSNIEGVYGKEFVREIRQLPEMQSDYTPKKINALEDIYSVGQEIQNKKSPNTRRLIEDIVKAGKDTPTTPLISIPLREWYRMHLNGKWTPKDAVNVMSNKVAYIYKYPLVKEYSGILKFLLETNWYKDTNEDWKKWKEKGNEYVVLYKKNRDYLISYDQAKRIRYIPDKHDYAQTPQKTREKRGGDCEDFGIEAAYDMEVLEKAGSYTNVEVVNSCNMSLRRGHSFLTYKKDNEDGIYVMDNARRTGIRKFSSIIEAGKQIANEGGYESTHIWAYNWRTFYSNYGNFPYNESLI